MLTNLFWAAFYLCTAQQTHKRLGYPTAVSDTRRRDLRSVLRVWRFPSSLRQKCSLALVFDYGFVRRRSKKQVEGAPDHAEVLGYLLRVHVRRGQHPLGHLELVVGQRLGPPAVPPSSPGGPNPGIHLKVNEHSLNKITLTQVGLCEVVNLVSSCLKRSGPPCGSRHHLPSVPHALRSYRPSSVSGVLVGASLPPGGSSVRPKVAPAATGSSLTKVRPENVPSDAGASTIDHA